MTLVFRYDRAGVLDSDRVQRTPQGGIRAPARFTRVGVLEYELPDGSKRREYRPPEEVFKEDSLATLIEAPITYRHPFGGKVTPENFQDVTIGFTSSDIAPEEGRFVAGTALIQSAFAVRSVEAREATEFSAGYVSRLDMTPGIVPEGQPDAGQPYDCVQRDIKYNHVALLPRGEGRAGPEVSLRLDSSGHQIAPDKEETKMELTPEEIAALKALAAAAPQLMKLASPEGGAETTVDNEDDPEKRTDNTEEPNGNGGNGNGNGEEETPADALTVEEVNTLKSLVAAEKIDNENDPAAPAQKEDEDEETKNDSKRKTAERLAREQERLILDSIELRDRARAVLGKNYSFRGKTNRQVMADVILHVDSKFPVQGKSDEALSAVFEMALARYAERAASKRDLERVQAVTTLNNDSASADGLTSYLANNIAQASSRRKAG